jgi:hypothetical protein
MILIEIKVPGDWTDAEIAHHTELLVAAKLANSGHVCASPQVSNSHHTCKFESDFNEITPSKLLRNNIKVKEKFYVMLVYSYHPITYTY